MPKKRLVVIGFVGRAAESRQQFSTFLQNNFLGQNGRQICNACHVLQAQAAVRKRAATSSVARLEPLRKKIHRMQILRETWEAIAQSRSALQGELQQSPTASQQQVYVYTCPFCQGSVTTSIASGNIDHRRVCGKQFRVCQGLLRPTRLTLRYSHACPTCGTRVNSTKACGRIQSKHKQPNGRTCRRRQWHTG